MFAIDTNIIVYAHNTKSYCHKESKRFIEDVMNKRDENGQLFVCIPTQVLMEFVHVVTWERLESPISLKKALTIVKEYLETGIRIIHQKDTQLQTFMELCQMVNTRKKVFDLALLATLKDNHISGLYTRNVKDFEDFNFIQVINPLLDKEK